MYLILSAELPAAKLLEQVRDAIRESYRLENLPGRVPSPVPPVGHFTREARPDDFEADPDRYAHWQLDRWKGFQVDVTAQCWTVLYGIRVNPQDVPITKLDIVGSAGANRLSLAPHKLYVPTGKQDQYDATGYLEEPLMMAPDTLWRLEVEFAQPHDGLNTLLLLAMVAP